MSYESKRVLLTKMMADRKADFGFPIAFPNLPFEVPKNAVYGEFWIIPGGAPINVGGEGRGKVREREIGFVQLTVWIPKDSGTKPGTQAEDIFGDIYKFKQRRDSTGSIFKFKGLTELNPSTKDGWECKVYRVGFTVDTVTTVEIIGS